MLCEVWILVGRRAGETQMRVRKVLLEFQLGESHSAPAGRERVKQAYIVNRFACL